MGEQGVDRGKFVTQAVFTDANRKGNATFVQIAKPCLPDKLPTLLAKSGKHARHGNSVDFESLQEWFFEWE